MGNLDSYDRGMSTIQTTGYSVMKAGDQFAGIIQIGNIVNNVEDSYGAKAEEYFNDLQDLASITPLVVLILEHALSNSYFLNRLHLEKKKTLKNTASLI